MKLLTIIEKNDEYIVTDHFSEYSPVSYSSYSSAIDLCRSRTHKNLANDVTVIRVPFVKLWIVW